MPPYKIIQWRLITWWLFQWWCLINRLNSGDMNRCARRARQRRVHGMSMDETPLARNEYETNGSHSTRGTQKHEYDKHETWFNILELSRFEIDYANSCASANRWTERRTNGQPLIAKPWQVELFGLKLKISCIKSMIAFLNQNYLNYCKTYFPVAIALTPNGVRIARRARLQDSRLVLWAVITI